MLSKQRTVVNWRNVFAVVTFIEKENLFILAILFVVSF